MEDFGSLVSEAIPEQRPSTCDSLGFSQVSKKEFKIADLLDKYLSVIDLLCNGSFVCLS